jgi:broad specificity phosphatase PhoE
MSSILLASAGTSIWEEQRRLQGARSLPLSPRGREEVRELARQLGEMPLRALYTAPSLHCRESAAILAEGRRVRIRCLEDLREVDHGLWEGLRSDELEWQFGRAYRAWLHRPGAVRPPQGEGLAQAYERAAAAVDRMARRHPGQLVGIVAPRLLGALIQCYLRGLGPECVWRVSHEDVAWEVLPVPEPSLGRA